MDLKRVNKVKTLLLIAVAIFLISLSYSATLDNVHSTSKGEQNTFQLILLKLTISGIYPVDHSHDSCEATIVTAYFRMASKHSHEEYLAWMGNVLSLRDCVVVFTQSDLVDTIRRLRPVWYPTRIIETDITQVKSV